MIAGKSYRYLDLIMAVFVTVLVVSNIASSAKIVDLGFSLVGVPMAFDGGTILFPISYIFGDILTEVYGYKNSRRVIWIGFGCLALSALVFAILRFLPAEANWQGYAGDAAYLAILGGMSSGGIVLASLGGYWSGSFSNSFVLAKMKVLTRGRWLWMRTIGSTIAGELVDTLGLRHHCVNLQGVLLGPVPDPGADELSVQMRGGSLDDAAHLCGGGEG